MRGTTDAVTAAYPAWSCPYLTLRIPGRKNGTGGFMTVAPISMTPFAPSMTMPPKPFTLYLLAPFPGSWVPRKAMRTIRRFEATTAFALAT